MIRCNATRQPVGTSVGRCSNLLLFVAKEQPAPRRKSSRTMPSSGSCLGMKSSAKRLCRGLLALSHLRSLQNKSNKTHHCQPLSAFPTKPHVSHTYIFFQDLFSRLTVLLRFDPCCMFVVSIIMDPDLIRIESYHSETLTLGATKTWAQLNHLNTSGYLIRILSADLPVVSSLSLCWAIRLFPDSLLCVCALAAWVW